MSPRPQGGETAFFSGAPPCGAEQTKGAMTMSEQRTIPSPGEPPKDVDDLIFSGGTDHSASQR